MYKYTCIYTCINIHIYMDIVILLSKKVLITTYKTHIEL